MRMRALVPVAAAMGRSEASATPCRTRYRRVASSSSSFLLGMTQLLHGTDVTVNSSCLPLRASLEEPLYKGSSRSMRALATEFFRTLLEVNSVLRAKGARPYVHVNGTAVCGNLLAGNGMLAVYDCNSRYTSPYWRWMMKSGQLSLFLR